MGYDLSIFWVWLIFAGLLGGVVGYRTGPRQTGNWLAGWFKWAIVIFFVGILLALFSIFHGRWGLLLEVALLFFASYSIGGYFGTFLFTVLERQHGRLRETLAPSPQGLNAVNNLTPSPIAQMSHRDAAQTIEVVQTIENDAAKADIAPEASAVHVVPGLGSSPSEVASEVKDAATTKLPDVDLLPGGQTAADFGRADDLTLISTISKHDEIWLNQRGIFHYAQLAAWTDDDCRAVMRFHDHLGKAQVKDWKMRAEGLISGQNAETSVAPSRAKSAAVVEPADARVADLKFVQGLDTSSGSSSEHLPIVVKPSATALIVTPVESDDHLRTHLRMAATAANVARSVKNDQSTADGLVKNLDKPPSIDVPSNGADDLKWIKGIGPRNEAILHGLGIFKFVQIADWTSSQQQWIGDHMAFPGRVEREHWVDQAKVLAMGLQTDHSLGRQSGTIAVDERSDALLDASEAQAIRNSLPQFSATVEGEDRHSGSRPFGLQAPLMGSGDNLQKISGIGPQNQSRLNALGIYYFSQIACWTVENVQWIGSYLAFPGRIDRERWIEQANLLAQGKDASAVRRHERSD